MNSDIKGVWGLGGGGLISPPCQGGKGAQIGHQKQNKRWVELRLVIAAEISSVFPKSWYYNFSVLFYRKNRFFFQSSHYELKFFLKEYSRYFYTVAKTQGTYFTL